VTAARSTTGRRLLVVLALVAIAVVPGASIVAVLIHLWRRRAPRKEAHV